MSKYSPGPWQWNRRWLYSAETPAKIILSYTTDDDGVHSTDEDARLIAAAPELLAVLERYVNAYPAFRIKPEGAPGSLVRIEQERLMALESAALAVILKATGEV